MRAPPARLVRAFGLASRSPLRARAWLLLGLWAGAAALPVPADAQGSGGRSPSERAAAGLTDTLAKKLVLGSKVLVRPFATRYTGLPENTATRLEGLIVRALSTRIPENMKVTLVTGEDVARIYRGLEKSSFDGASENLLTSVLKAARADTIIACEHVGKSRPDSLGIQCGATYGKLVCTDGSDDIGRCEAVKVADVRSLGSETAAFPWASPGEHLEHVFSYLAWKLVGASPPDVPGEVAIGAEAARRKTLFSRFISSRLKIEVEKAIRNRVGWRRVEGPSGGPPVILDWSIIPWGKKRYWLTATLKKEGDNPDGGGFSVTEDTHIAISSLPSNLRLIDPGPGGTGDGDGDPPPPDDPVGIERDKFTVGLETAFRAGDYPKVLSYAAKLDALGGALPARVDYFRGAALFRADRPGEAVAALKGYVERAGGEGRYYREALGLLLEAEEVLAHAAAEREKAERERLERERAERARAAAREEAARKARAAASREEALGLDYAARVGVQRGLASLGMEVGSADGVFGDRTRAALGRWQARRGLAATGYLTRDQAEALVAAGRRAEREKAEREEAARKEAEHAVGRVFRDCPGCPEMVVVPAGSFTMGSPASEEGRWDSEGPVHRVTIPAPFAVGKYEVTRGEFARFVSATGRDTGSSCRIREDGSWKSRSGRSWRSPGFAQTDRDPAVCVSWEDARAYARWLSGRTGKEYRLLSESEWEYAARAGTTTRYWWGNAIGRNRANCRDCGSRWDDKSTAPVGSFAANGFGLHDMHGNVWEWVEDCWGWNDGYAGAPSDGRARKSGDCGRRVLRGGGWSNSPRNIRAANRGWDDPGNRSSFSGYGFRVARTLAR